MTLAKSETRSSIGNLPLVVSPIAPGNIARIHLSLHLTDSVVLAPSAQVVEYDIVRSRGYEGDS